ncbi:MAG: site-specific DNA-methyltransferase [Clostridiales bacterium]|nr:site-specific DNA-methyltransferase [Clostridiales bacterium]
MERDKQRAPRNRTLRLTREEEACCLEQCIKPCEIDGLPENRIILGDAFEALGRLPERCVDLLIVDPPYNLSKTYGTRVFRKMGASDYADFTRAWLDAVRRTLKETASVYVCCDWVSSLIIGSLLGEYFTVRSRITWQREKGRGALKNWKNALEDIWFATVSDTYTFNVRAVMQRRRVIAPYRENGRPKDWMETDGGRFRDTYPSNFWDDISIPYWSMPENTDHPAQKPEKLMAKLILASSNPGDLVLDPFGGVGTSAVVAKKLGRRFICIEREASYCALAQKRLELAEANPAIQGYYDGVFWERNTLLEQKRRARELEKGSIK